MNKLLISCGIPFAGKSTLAAAIVRRFGHAETDVGEVKDRLCGCGVDDSELMRSDWVRIYAETDMQMLRLLQSGRSVVDDSRNCRKQARHLQSAWRLALVLLFSRSSLIHLQQLLASGYSRTELLDCDMMSMTKTGLTSFTPGNLQAPTNSR